MSNPYQPPAPDRRRVRIVWVRFAIAAILVTLVMFVFWPVVESVAPSWRFLGGPFWYRSETGNEVIGGALVVFCLATIQSALICPKWYTAIAATLGAAVWVGASIWTAAHVTTT